MKMLHSLFFPAFLKSLIFSLLGYSVLILIFLLNKYFSIDLFGKIMDAHFWQFGFAIIIPIFMFLGFAVHLNRSRDFLINNNANRQQLIIFTFSYEFFNYLLQVTLSGLFLILVYYFPERLFTKKYLFPKILEFYNIFILTFLYIFWFLHQLGKSNFTPTSTHFRNHFIFKRNGLKEIFLNKRRMLEIILLVLSFVFFHKIISMERDLGTNLSYAISIFIVLCFITWREFQDYKIKLKYFKRRFIPGFSILILFLFWIQCLENQKIIDSQMASSKKQINAYESCGVFCSIMSELNAIDLMRKASEDDYNLGSKVSEIYPGKIEVLNILPHLYRRRIVEGFLATGLKNKKNSQKPQNILEIISFLEGFYQRQQFSFSDRETDSTKFVFRHMKVDKEFIEKLFESHRPFNQYVALSLAKVNFSKKNFEALIEKKEDEFVKIEYVQEFIKREISSNKNNK